MCVGMDDKLGVFEDLDILGTEKENASRFQRLSVFFTLLRRELGNKFRRFVGWVPLISGFC